MAREYIEQHDTLNEGRKKLNKSITRAYESEEKSGAAVQTANEARLFSIEAKGISEEANTKSDNTQTQLDTVTGASTIDPAVEQLKVGFEGETYPSPDARIRSEYEKIFTLLKYTADDLESRGVNALNPPAGYDACKGDGVTDDTAALQNLINNFSLVILPINHIYRVTDTIFLRQRRKTLMGTAHPSGSGENVARILYDGPTNRKKAVVVLGQSDVGTEPNIDASGLNLKNLIVDGNLKAGFGVYGTYLTNETTVDGVIARNTLEYGQYYARGWYATLRNLTAINNKGKGLAFGMPLKYQSGEVVNWSTPSPLELNNTLIDNVRSIRSGTHFSEDNPGTFSVLDEEKRDQGYGIGFGIGNAFNAQNYLSESSGGVNLYVYTGPQPIKTISNGYLENAMYKSEAPEEHLTNIIIEHTTTEANPYLIENIFMNLSSGGIYFTGNTGRKVWIKNISTPTFLKSLDGLSNNELFSIVLKDNVNYRAGFYNTLNALAISTKYELNVNVRYSWEIELPRIERGVHKIYARLSEGNTRQPESNIYATDPEISSNTQNRVYGELTSEWQEENVWLNTGERCILSMGGNGGIYNTPVDFKIVTIPTSTY